MPKKRSKRTKKRQVSTPKNRKVQRSRVPQKRGYVWVRGPIGPSGRRKPGYFRKKPARKPVKRQVRKPARKPVKRQVRKPARKPVKRQVRKTSKAAEIRKRFADTEISNTWTYYNTTGNVYHERWVVPPVLSKLSKFTNQYGDINAHMTVGFVDKETGEVVYRSTNIVAANEIELGIELLDNLLNRYAAQKQLGPVQTFEVWFHDNPKEFIKRNLLF